MMTIKEQVEKILIELPEGVQLEAAAKGRTVEEIREAIKAGVSYRWIKDYKEVLGCNDWDFKEKHIIDGVCYEHGEGSAPHIKMLRNRRSYVCGHIHSKLSITYSVSDHDILFAMQVGWGGDQNAYAMEYAKNFQRGVVSCGVVLENGQTPIVIPMKL